MHGKKVEDDEKQEIFSITEFEVTMPSIKNNSFHQRMMNFVNRIELSLKTQTNGNVRDENYKENLLFTLEDFVSLVTYHQSMYFMSIRFIKDNINGVHVTQL